MGFKYVSSKETRNGPIEYRKAMKSINTPVWYVIVTSWLVQSMASSFSTVDHIPAVIGERRDKKREQDTANDVKLQGIVSHQCTTKKRLLLGAKHTGAWLSVRGNTVTGTVIAATEFRDFYVLVIMLTPLISKTSATVACKTFWRIAI